MISQENTDERFTETSSSSYDIIYVKPKKEYDNVLQRGYILLLTEDVIFPTAESPNY